MDIKDKELIKEVLLQGMPILFLGAGFSYGALQKDGNPIPMGKDLKKLLFDTFIDNNKKLDDKEKHEIETMNLRDMCEAIDSLKMSEEMKEYLTECFSHCNAAEYHKKITLFPWKKIYTVNIDDIVEQQYRKSRKKYVVQNEEKKKIVSQNTTEIIKLHGCVNAPEEPYVFSSSDYIDLISGGLEYRLNDLANDLQSQNFIIVGASLDEPDMQYYFTLYEKAGYQLGRGRILCINHSHPFKLNKMIEKVGGHAIQATTEEFLNYIEELNYNPDDLERSLSRLEYSGIYSYKKIMASLKREVHESSIYQGYESTWRDLNDKWLFTSPTYQCIAKRIKEISVSGSNIYCIAIHGKRFSGKGCLIKLLSMHLDNEGYEVLYYHGEKLDINSLVDYIKTSPNNRFALMIPSAAFFYKDVESLFKRKITDKRILVITTSREYYHNKKKYYLDGNPHEEFEIDDSIDKEYAEMIYETLQEKGYTGWLSRSKDNAIPQICRTKTLVNLLSSICFGKGFQERLRKDLVQIRQNDKINHLYVLLAVIDRADLEFYPKKLLWGKYKLYFKQDKPSRKGRIVVDYISYNEKGLMLKNKILTSLIWDNTTKEEKKNCIIEILQNVSPYVSEYENSYWRIIFESLTYEKWLTREAGFSTDEALDIYYSLKNYYGTVSYYWLQLGIAEQEKGDFQKAQAHLDMAAEIRPRAFQIQHAIARNYLRHANSMRMLIEAEPIFEKGRKKMMDLIDSEEFNKKRARDYSIHCYVTEYIKYIGKFYEKPSKKQVEEMKKLIDIMIDREDKYYKSLISKYARFLKKTNTTEYVKLQLQDPLINEIMLIDENDYILDSYQ